MKDERDSVGSIPSGLTSVEPVQNPHGADIVLPNPEELLNACGPLQLLSLLLSSLELQPNTALRGGIFFRCATAMRDSICDCDATSAS